MQTPNQFINWLEGYLDALNDKLTVAQVRAIRKKIKEVSDDARPANLLFDSHVPMSSSRSPIGPIKSPDYDDFLREVENNRNASTVEELNH